MTNGMAKSNGANNGTNHANANANGNAGQAYCVGIDKLKFFLIPFVCFGALGFPSRVGGYVASLSGFAAPCFFILCGFLVLWGNAPMRKDRLLRAIKRAGLLFLLLLVCYFLANVLYCHIQGIPWTAVFFNKKSLIFFAVLNVWPLPMGDTIWFIQALLYAYIFLLLINRWYDNVILRRVLLIASIAFMLVTGEFAGVLGIKFFGRGYLPAGAVTRALPYLLIGSFLREKAETLFFLPPFLYPILSLIGIVAAVGEFYMLAQKGILVDSSHSLGLGFTAISLACWAIVSPEASTDFFAVHGRTYSKWIYASFQLVALAVILYARFVMPGSYGEIVQMGGVLVYGICIVIAICISMVKFMIWIGRNQDEGEWN